jgi:hypothetical protein
VHTDGTECASWTHLLQASEERSHMVMIVVFQLLIILMFGLGTWGFAYALRQGLKSGRCYMKNRYITREHEPIFYWSIIVMLVVWVILLPFSFIYMEYFFIQMVIRGTFPP